MHRILANAFLCALALTTAFAQEPARGASTITFGLGGGWLASANEYNTEGGPVFNGTYEYRISRHWALAGGVHTTLTTIDSLYYFYPSVIMSKESRRNTSTPVYALGIQPIMNGRMELFFGLGGGYMWNSAQPYQGWEGQSTAGARYAIDKQRHVWIGTSAEYWHEFNIGNQNWISWTANFGYRFATSRR